MKIALLPMLLLCGCAAIPPESCPARQRAAVQELIYFGAGKPGGLVTPEEWASFLGEVVTPRFPAGLTTWDAAGQWRSAEGSLTHEPSRVLNLVHDGAPGSEAAVIAIVDAYKTRFHQEAVLRVNTRACMSL